MLCGISNKMICNDSSTVLAFYAKMKQKEANRTELLSNTKLTDLMMPETLSLRNESKFKQNET